MKAVMLAAALALAAPAAAPCEDAPRYLLIAHRVTGGDLISFSEVFPDQATAEAMAERVGVCGFWRVDPGSAVSSLVPPGAVIQVFVHGLEGPPPAQLEQGAPVPPPPTAERIVNCAAAGRSRLAVVKH
jgi:hypothetical protein